MTDIELADRFKNYGIYFYRGMDDAVPTAFTNEECEQIIAALRRADLAQTEIKGHMRVVDELKAEVASLERKLDDIVNTMKHAGMKVPGWIEHTDKDGKLRRDNLTIAATLVFELEAWQARIAELEKALSRIAKWFGEFPATGDSWTDGSPVSYGAAFGSNGERDYMRSIAREALKSRA